MFKIFSSLFDSNERQLLKIKPIIESIGSFEKGFSKLSDEELKKNSQNLREKIGYKKEKARMEFSNLDEKDLKLVLSKEKEKLEKILPEAFALVREASKRVANHRHFDVQMMAGYFLFKNMIVEVFTGEGKTLAANMPLYLYGLTGRGAHLVTVNDYLARRDAEWNGHILNFLGLTVGVVNNNSQYRYITDDEAIKLKGAEAKKLIKERNERVQLSGSMKYDHMSGVNLIECSKKEAYACDVLYGTNNEFGFDYLRDNMSQSIDDIVQGPLYFSIVDEADSILIDEARTPLIISTSARASNDMYVSFAKLVRSLSIEKDYTVDEKSKAVSLNDEGIDRIEKELGVKNVYEDVTLAYHIENALKAKELYRKDKEYIVRNGEVLIVDEFTGRVLSGRRYSEGLHQAIEAKEGVEVKRESRTMATITLQNYFRLYKYMSGMTGTALTEAEEFSKIYKLDTIVIPTNKNIVRKDLSDVVYRSQEGKFKAIVNDIKEHNTLGQPVLVGTTSVEKSEILSEMLNKEGLKHNVLNAKQLEKEAKIVAEAGQKGQVTIATNMAGRGTDISLGEGVRELGGLYIIGSERHESRRIDNQLRGRSGRQGDPGKSRFYVSFEDDLMRLFGGDSMGRIMQRVGMGDDMEISLGLIGRSIESAQKRVEAHNYDIRKNLVEYDDVLNKQREIVYGVRRKILSTSHNWKFVKKEVTLSEKSLRELDIVKLRDELESFVLSDKSTWDLGYIAKISGIEHPIVLWVYKKVVGYTEYILRSQTSDDSKIDKTEKKNILEHIKSLLGEDLFDITLRLLGYKNSEAFTTSFDNITVEDKKLEILIKVVSVGYIFHINALGFEGSVEVCKLMILQTIENLWMEHLDTMGDLREGISLRSMAQKDPLVEYKNEAFRLFNSMLDRVDEAISSRIMKVRIVKREKNIEGDEIKEPSDTVASVKRDKRPGEVSKQATVVRRGKKVGRNDLCPCGSGKKYKKCCYPKYG